MVQDEIRRRNLGTLLRHVHLGGSLSRAALGERMGLNRSTIMALTAELTAAGLVREEPPTDTGRAGRPSLVVSPESTRVYVLAFDVAVDWLVAARVGLGGVILDRRRAPRPRAGADLDRVVEVLAWFGRQLHEAAPPASVCVGVSASYCGMIRPGDGMVRFGPDMGWVDQAFGTELGRRLGLGLPVSVGNEAHLGALAEQQRGAGVGFRNLIYLHGDVGVGGGIIVGGKLLDGEGGYGCELGHMVVNPYDGRPCGCGSRGCLEAEVGERALLDAAGRPAELFGRDALRAVVDDAGHGDPVARDALHRVGDWLGIGVANLINLFNPGIVIFGGMLRDVYPGAADPVRARIAANVLPVARERVRLHTSALGDDATLAGAAELGFSELLTDPLGTLARPATGGWASTSIASSVSHSRGSMTGMATSKQPVTVPTDASVDDFLAAVPDERRRADAERLCTLLREVTGEPAVMWGPSIVGFGSYRYTYDSGRTGDWPLVGFSPRKQQLVVYLVGGFEERHASVLARLGPHKTGKGCLYLKRLDDVDESALRELVDRTVRVHKGVDRASRHGH